MTEAVVIVEGVTEEGFVREVLCPHLLPRGLWAWPILTGTRRTRRDERGGHRGAYRVTRDDISRTLKQHGRRGACVTTMLDLYGLPNDFPGYATAAVTPDPYQRVAAIEDAMSADIADHRFVPYIQLHEFEALLLAEPGKIAGEYPDAADAVAQLAAEAARFQGPEWVNDDPATTPSKRVKKHVPRYDKVRSGPRITASIGLERLRAECPHFGLWLTRLEALATCQPSSLE